MLSSTMQRSDRAYVSSASSVRTASVRRKDVVSCIHDFDALLAVYRVSRPFDFVGYETVKCLYEFVDFFLHSRMG